MSLNYLLRSSTIRRATRLTLIGLLAMAPVSLVACSQGNQPGDSASPAADSAPPDTQMNSGSEAPAGKDMVAIDLGPADETFDLRFIDAMILHHRGAIIMARQAAQRSTRPEVKAAAEQVVETQQKEIRQLNAWRRAWYADAEDQPVKYDAATQQTVALTEEEQAALMMVKQLGQPNERFDLRYIRAMVPHHRTAVTLAREAIEKSERPQLKRLARQIVETQNAAANQLREWRKTWYGGTPQ